ncbi:DNA-directed RNA polymerase subunit beta' [Candidatus Roizmanbacteria bacterium RIFOXYB2_FULL_41_10]|uniref:DNA-directed RNA polymerase subunit beta' n=1 Tax=Candidatus Roizmanbacteria bacterium RIFOXYA1_FULL_41_12 TaxID=1802082 RepID=A0A1F7KF13_9BACT|nr:MAG: DNA-directed RNA polymerase subunit beta' [Candidatus Roizmanbacteria bacterium RIFOXYA1_FULL_41_12]OGK68153.1 MAG: DNA-directed RNA polymerase subunit beta' [Candidatus Roizmanbacteria bacterium RIFOXYB1_FULL_41_27]OGK69411.1 MAG: DNA-directed RNA polymerase subunit beta' [Candidatus Roizmanbacteria bacterium RIFOXYB2_FULL_41_10]OGK71939.1 MAG: DNA-directed RNA polymerase subunit beta' [Candidatus Roizmanbacteria bacterium RIFOXYC1_FULL_41_16]OGK75346.1 MAG: DNA-directed RNA polymerase
MEENKPVLTNASALDLDKLLGKKNEEVLFRAIKISLSSPDQILTKSHGEVTKAETINYRTFKPEKDGLFDERIFGPTKDFECYCGKYRRIRYKGIVCDRCGVEVTSSSVRRERMGHITLAAPVAHIWFFKTTSSPMSLILGIPANALERIIYFALYLTKGVKDDKRKEAEKVIRSKEKESKVNLDEWYGRLQKDLKASEDKEIDHIKKKITNKDRHSIAESETRHKFKQKRLTLANEYQDKKTIQEDYYNRLAKLAKSIRPMDVLEEDDYLSFRELGISDLVEVGMGAEVILEVLSSLDMNKLIADLNKRLAATKGEAKTKLLKRIRAVEAFVKAKIEPKWMTLTVLPVIPPDLRPMVQLTGGKFATSDLNDFYRRVINRNNRLRHLIELGAPNIILRNEKRMLQEAVDSLIDLSKSSGRATRAGGAGIKKKKSLSDILKGKQGRFRQNLLGKRVDYSGRSVIVVGPELKIDQFGLPKEMALELYKPFILRDIINQGFATNIKSAKNFFESKDPVIYDILEKVVENYPVLLNRAPTLHKLSILAFYPVLTDDIAIRLHPCVCQGYNADFDGDAMGVFVPLSKGAIEEAKKYMLPSVNLLKPADGSLIAIPNKEMVLGLYFLTSQNEDITPDEKKLSAFASVQEVRMAYQLKKVDLRQLIYFKHENEVVKTTVGRVFLNEKLPLELGFINTVLKAADVKALTKRAMKVLPQAKVAELIDQLKDLGFWAATKFSGASFSVTDCIIYDDKKKVVNEAETSAAEIDSNYQQGLVTLNEKRELINNVWIETTEKLADLTWDAYKEENPVKVIIKSGGARASREQLKQISGIKGLIYDPLGKIVEMPTKSNYREGLTIFEYFTNTRGARKGLADSALKTADAGYLTRRLVDVAHDVIVKEDDCGEKNGILVSRTGIRGDKFNERVINRYLAKDVKNGKKVLFKVNTLVTDEILAEINQAKIEKVEVRSPLLCQTKRGLCRKCYGSDFTTSKTVEIGVPVGVVAAQSIGEPGTQLTMRVRHFGGIVISDVTQGLPRVEELLETRTPKVISPIAEIDGKAKVREDNENELYQIEIATTDGKITKFYQIPMTQRLHIKNGQLVTKGTQLSEGYLDIKEVLEIRGIRSTQMYLLHEIQNVYESQGIGIHDKHFEVIIRKMSDKIIIDDEGDTNFLMGEAVNKDVFIEENKKIVAKGGKPASGKTKILGITNASIFTDSWLSAASFQNTTNVLTRSAIKGQMDYLYGLKENVIIGRLIPVTEKLINKYYK